MFTNPLFLQYILCWIENVDPQAHVVGKFFIGKPYRNLILSQNYCCFMRSDLFPTIGNTGNQFDTPSSLFIAFSLFWSFVDYSSKFCKMFSHRSSFSAFILLFSFKTSDELTVYIGSFLKIKFVSCLMIIRKFWWYIQSSFVGRANVTTCDNWNEFLLNCIF